MENKLSLRAEKTVNLLKARGLTVACAESCTGGMLSSAIVSVSGASSVMEMSITSYSARIKRDVLGVNSKTVRDFGTVSRQTAREMAVCVRRLASSSIGVAVTGVAGPEPCEGKAVGTVYIALTDGHTVTVQRLDIGNVDRLTVREVACMAVFDLIDNYIEGRT